MSIDTPDAPSSPAPAPRSPIRYPLVMKWVRRTHMYLGLLLFPWMIVFGVSGVLFNHPDVGEDVAVREVPAEQLQAITGMAPVAPEAVAKQLVEQLNANGGTYRLESSSDPHFSGFTVLLAPGEGVNNIVIVNLDEGSATVSTRSTVSPKPKLEAPFAGDTVTLPEYSMAAIEAKLAPLLTKLDVPAKSAPKASPRGAPELRFKMLDANQQAWNVTYNLGSGLVDGRPADAARVLSVNELLTKLHVLHHYPSNFGVMWLWALFADISGVMIVFWALSGLFMWWQMRPTRVLGIGALSLAIGLGLAVIGGTLVDLQFGNVQKRTGPGGGAPPKPKPAPAGETKPAAVTTDAEADHH